ncbi:hypothetical protein ACFVT5_05650 [Streptomyces sp. NPDC058001]|uniref:hypothetical protein n=1 Tax=Streptomyces sp. NPDC058001 TaxID=3346300 RepID=UPI0036F05882
MSDRTTEVSAAEANAAEHHPATVTADEPRPATADDRATGLTHPDTTPPPPLSRKIPPPAAAGSHIAVANAAGHYVPPRRRTPHRR